MATAGSAVVGALLKVVGHCLFEADEGDSINTPTDPVSRSELYALETQMQGMQARLLAAMQRKALGNTLLPGPPEPVPSFLKRSLWSVFIKPLDWWATGDDVVTLRTRLQELEAKLLAAIQGTTPAPRSKL